jgi:hypothetical protein
MIYCHSQLIRWHFDLMITLLTDHLVCILDWLHLRLSAIGADIPCLEVKVEFLVKVVGRTTPTVETQIEPPIGVVASTDFLGANAAIDNGATCPTVVKVDIRIGLTLIFAVKTGGVLRRILQ